MSIRKKAITFLVAIFSIVGGVSYTAMAEPTPDDVTVPAAMLAVDAVNDVAEVPQEGTVNIKVLANDVGTNLKVKSVTQGMSGAVKISPEGGVRYTPNSGFKGVDSFTYTISDGQASDTAEVTVTVNPVDNPCQSNLNGLTGEVSFDKIHRTVTYKVVLPRPTCDATTLSGDTYVLPKGYDRSGEFNESATPARYKEKARSNITIPRGYRIAQTTRPLSVQHKSGGWIMGAIYNSAHQDIVNMPGLPETVSSEITKLPRVHQKHHHRR